MIFYNNDNDDNALEQQPKTNSYKQWRHKQIENINFI